MILEAHPEKLITINHSVQEKQQALPGIIIIPDLHRSIAPSLNAIHAEETTIIEATRN